MLSMFDTGSLLVQILPLNAIKSKLYINYREAAWYTCTANHICVVRHRVHGELSLSIKISEVLVNCNCEV